MRAVLANVTALLCVVASPVLAQAPANPVTTAFHGEISRAQRNIVAAVQDMPADKFNFRPTPAQMSFAQAAVHIAQGNDMMCGWLSGEKPPTPAKVDSTSSKDSLVAALQASFAFCHAAASKLDDSKLGVMVPFFGGRQMTRAAEILTLVGDWYDHYSAYATYMRLNGVLPPTARPRPAT